MSEVVTKVHTPDGEVIQIDPVARLRECEEKLEQAMKDAAHYKTVARLLAEKMA